MQILSHTPYDCRGVATVGPVRLLHAPVRGRRSSPPARCGGAARWSTGATRPLGPRHAATSSRDRDRQPAPRLRRRPGRAAPPGPGQRRRLRPPGRQHGLGELRPRRAVIRHHGCAWRAPGTRRAACVVVAVAGRVACSHGCGLLGDPDPTTPPQPRVGRAGASTTVRAPTSSPRDPRPSWRARSATCCRRTSCEAFLGDYPRARTSCGPSTPSPAGRRGSAAGDIERAHGRAGRRTPPPSRATRLDARLSFLVAAGDVVGATAAVDFAFDATMADGATRPLSLRGRLLLEQDDGRWVGLRVRRRVDDGSAVAAEVAS